MASKDERRGCRTLGVLAAVFSLPHYPLNGGKSPDQAITTTMCGDLGVSARKWIDLLHAWNARDWLMLPIGPGRVDRWLSLVRVMCYSKGHAEIDAFIEEVLAIPNLWFDKCPYVPNSAFAINSTFISEVDLFELCPIAETPPYLSPRYSKKEGLADLLYSWVHKQRVVGCVFKAYLEPLLLDPEFVWSFGEALQGLYVFPKEGRLSDNVATSCVRHEWVIELLKFVQEESSTWLCQYCFFEAITDYLAIRELKTQDFARTPGFGLDWAQWPEVFRRGELKSLLQLWNNPDEFVLEAVVGNLSITLDLLTSLVFHAFTQFIATRQLAQLKAYATMRHVSLIGDVPIYLPVQSADCWSHPEVFSIDVSGSMKPLFYGGTPPDYWSASGQLWGTPTYDWSQTTTKDWWECRLLITKSRGHKVRIDHFRAFADAWSIPQELAEAWGTGEEGFWREGPGFAFFKGLLSKYPEVFVPSEIIVEDLGEETEALTKMRSQMLFPRMVVFQFDIEEIAGHNCLRPRESSYSNSPQSETLEVSPGCDVCSGSWIVGEPSYNFVAFTGTHDNPSLAEWWAKIASKSTRKWLEAKVGRVAMRSERMPRFLLKWLFDVMKSDSTLIVPVQDLLCLGEESRINLPGMNDPKLWSWQMSEDHIMALSASSFTNWITSFH